MPLFIAAVVAAQSLTLTVRPVAGPRLQSSNPIVGRAMCQSRTLLLTKTGELVEVKAASPPAIAVRASPDLASRPQLWGLACLADGTMWTLESGHSLARLTRDARVAERIPLRVPWIALFGSGDRVLFQPLPTIAAVPVLSTAAPSALDRPTPWPGPIGRPGDGKTPALARNLVKCGVRSATLQPCWFADDERVVVSDGRTSRIVRVPEPVLNALDRSMPIWDVAVATPQRLNRGSESLPADRIWVLGASAPEAGRRRTPDTMILLDGERRFAEIRLITPARLVVFAAFDRCIVLLANGELLEVRAI
jgi:hypothetical protein